MANKRVTELNKFDNFIEERVSLSDSEQVYTAGNLIKEVQDVDVDRAYSAIQKRIFNRGKVSRIYTSISRYVAILILPLLCFSIWSYLNRESHEQCQEFAMQEITCPTGMRSRVTLPDGSLVWLNSESTIKYSLPFVNKDRSVELEGQAFLDVAKSEEVPFTIKSGSVRVNVVGTQFDFKSYPNDDNVEVTLKEGKIDLYLLDEEREVSKTEVEPGEHFVFNKRTKRATLSKGDIDNHIGWVDNKLIFDDTPMSEMNKMLERWYGVDIVSTDKTIAGYKFTTTFENEPLSQVIELLELSSPIKVKYIPAVIDSTTNQVINARLVISKKP